MKRTVIVTAMILLAVCSCRKEKIATLDCEHLQQSLFGGDTAGVQQEISLAINTLSSTNYTKENLELLADRLSSRCSRQVELVCFNCVYTTPPQSEIIIHSSSAGRSAQKIIDLTSSNEKIVFAGMHD
jgi:hypothetical protein